MTTYEKILKNYKLILIIWISVGILVGGYLLIEPIEHYKERKITIISDSVTRTTPRTYYDGNEGSIILLVTLVGGILIGGIGFLKNKKQE